MWTVYLLIDPRDGEIRYVGCTRKPKQRQGMAIYTFLAADFSHRRVLGSCSCQGLVFGPAREAHRADEGYQAMNIRILPKGKDRTWTRSFYTAINRVFRRIEYDNRAQIAEEMGLRLKNFYIYGTSHPELLAQQLKCTKP